MHVFLVNINYTPHNVFKFNPNFNVYFIINLSAKMYEIKQELEVCFKCC